MKSLLKKLLYHYPSVLADVMRLKSNWNRDKYVFLKLLRKGDVVLDVGGNIGDYCSTFASIVGSKGHVHTFEPVPTTYQKLKSNLELQNLKNTSVIPKAVSNLSGKVEIHMPGDDHARPAIHMKERESWDQELTVQTFLCDAITLDEYVNVKQLDTVNFVKIDVEGAEHLVLLGARGLLTSKSPILFFEMWESYMRDFGSTVNDYCHLLRQAGYDQFIGVQNVIHHFTDLEQELPSLLNNGILNIVCGKQALHRDRFNSF